MSQTKSTIRPLLTEDLGDFWEMHDEYHPNGITRQVEWYDNLKIEWPGFSYHGAYRNNKIVGGMAINDYLLNLRSQIVRLSSVGMVRTDKLHKKEKVCKDMMEYFIEFNKQKGINVLTLTAFRPDFYKSMGFGYGSCLYNYRIPPSSFPNKGTKEFLSYISQSERKAYNEGYGKVFEKNHGMINGTEQAAWFHQVLEEGVKRTLAYKEGGVIRGGLAFTSREREMTIENMFYDDTKVLHAFCSFIHSQADEFDRVLFSTPDEYFYYLLHDPTNGIAKNECCTSSINNMFRIIDVAGLFNELRDVNFNNQNAVIEISIRDTFHSQNSGVTVVEFTNGKVSVCSKQSSGANENIKMKIDISDFSSLIMGSINAKALYRLGLLETSDAGSLDMLEKIFTIGQKPLSVGGL